MQKLKLPLLEMGKLHINLYFVIFLSG